EFKRHERHITEALKSSEHTISNAIDDQNSSLRRLILPTWFWMIFSIVLVMTASWGVIWYQGKLITENLITISQQKDQIAFLESKGSKIQISTCGKESRLCVKVDLNETGYGSNQTKGYPWMIPEGY
ncbi:hypothetical protein, partial [Photobacterium sanguinicancri]|uniref:hypothetical protein n=1 Tax=Photobacterium sanguinicancri TaxID=875932 RepID=UPI0026E14174